MNKLSLNLMQSITLIVFASLIPALFFLDNSTTLVWTIVIPLVPILFITLGYSNWRNICPLAFFSKISQKITWFDKRKVPIWFEKNFYIFQFTLLFIAFNARLILLNFDNIFLAIFFIVVVIAAFLTNLFFTGKSWCNFFCPVAVVEKIYCGSNAHKYNTNSACTTCSACKKNCPDIDMESNYWKESINEQKSIAFYAFPGLVLGFYLYFFLQSGSFTYYFSGNWADNNFSLFSDGFFFAPLIPLIVAAPLSLALFSLLSYYLFKSLENYLWKKKIFKNINFSTLKHRVKVLAAFSAFNLFYAFAGAPAYMHFPLAYALFHFLVVTLSAIVLHREIFREESYFIQERFALKMIKRWKSQEPIPTNLKEIYYTYSNEKKNKAEQLKTYKESLHDLMQDGILNEDSMVILEKLRAQMGISEKDHFNTMRAIKLNNEDLFNANIEKSAEKIYQRNSYKTVLENALNEHQTLDSGLLKVLQKQFCISNEDHKEIVDTILNSNEKLQSDVLSLLHSLYEFKHIHIYLQKYKTRDMNFLCFTIRDEFNKISKELFTLLNLLYEENFINLEKLKQEIKYKNNTLNIHFTKHEINFIDDEIAEKLFALTLTDDKVIESCKPATLFEKLINHNSIYINSVALLNIDNFNDISKHNIDFTKFLNCSDEDVVEIALKIQNNTDNLTVYDKMIYLHNIPLFQTIKFDELSILANKTVSKSYLSKQDIIVQDSIGDSLFILISGEVIVQVDNKTINTLSEGDYFGEIAIIADTRRTATVRSMTGINTLKLSAKAFKEFIYDNPNIGITVMKEITNRLLQNKGIG